jgi:hypothetical protein
MESIVNKLFEEKNQQEIEKINQQIQENIQYYDDLDKIKKNSIYTYITDIDNEQLLLYIFIFITFVSMLIYSFEFNMTFIFSFLMGILLIYFLNEKSRVNNDSDLKQLEIKLNSIYPKPQYLHYDSRLINFIHENKDYQESNPDVYETMVKKLDNFMKIIDDIKNDVINCSHNFDIARDLSSEIMNEYESLFVNLPNYQNKEFYEKFRKMREDLQLILLNHLNVVQHICNRKFDKNVNNKDNYVEFMKPMGYQ